MKTKKTKWMDNAQVKRDLIDLLKTTPRKRWVQSVMSKYGGTPEGRVAVFQVFCKMEDSGELDHLKARESCEVSGIIAKFVPPPKLPTKRRMREVSKIIAKSGFMALCWLAVAVSSASADDHKAKRRSASAYALRRTEAGQVQGQPLIRRYSGGRTLDVYPNGLIYEGDNVVGVERRGK